MRHSLTLAVVASIATAGTAMADVITQWNFEAQTFNASTGTGLASLVGGTSSTFATGFAGTGTFALNTSTYAAQGTGDRTRGVQFTGSTAGYDSITLTWNERHSNTSANTVAVFASTDGTNWTEVQVFTFTPAATGTGDTWFQRSVSLSAAYANAANFGFRVLAAFNPGSSGYLASRSTSTYGTSSTLRFDDVTISGNVVPSPGAAALVGLAGLIARRRRA
jgi:MYXO-CTERM domain-containing protein